MTYRILSNFVSKFGFRWTRGFCGDRGLDSVAYTDVSERVVVKKAPVRAMVRDADFLKEADSWAFSKFLRQAKG